MCTVLALSYPSGNRCKSIAIVACRTVHRAPHNSVYTILGCNSVRILCTYVHRYLADLKFVELLGKGSNVAEQGDRGMHQ